jgi:hypothetical protein
MDLPCMIRIRQKLEAPILKEIPQEIASQVNRLRLEKKVKRGQTVAVACSSRGIANYSTIVEATVRSLQELGLEPFIIPAMGSHGAATAEGQKKVLDNSGISEEKMGIPIRSSLETVQIGEIEDHIPVLLDKMASEADYIVPVNRIKSHTDFEYELESGLIKMMTIGLGKQRGAAMYHQAFFKYGYPRIILAVARKVLLNRSILFGVATVENGYGQTARIDVLSPKEFEDREKELLKFAKRLEPRLPFGDVDILIIDEMGKDISGTGIDTKVVGRIYMPLLAKEPEVPRIKRIIICDLTENSEGNAVGIGVADFVTKRLVDKVNVEATYVNAITGGDVERVRIPLTLRNVQEAVEVAARSVGLIHPEALRVMRIKNTKHLVEVEISEAYKEEVSQRKDLEIIIEKRPLVFDMEGNLEPF